MTECKHTPSLHNGGAVLKVVIWHSVHYLLLLLSSLGLVVENVAIREDGVH